MEPSIRRDRSLLGDCAAPVRGEGGMDKRRGHFQKVRSKPNLFLPAFRFEDITYSAAQNSFAFHGIAPEDDFGI
jgi:hypothetical protein